MRRGLLDEPAAQALGNGRRPIARTELLVNMVKMSLDGSGAEEEDLGDLARRSSLSGLLEDFQLASCQPAMFRLSRRPSTRERPAFVEESPRRLVQP